MSESTRSRALGERERAEYVNCLTAEAVPSRQQPFYVTRVNQFIRAANGRPIESLDEKEIGDVLASFGRRDDLSDWQFAQLVDAVRVYLVGLLKSESATRVDWAYWKGSARTLTIDHASSARESRPEELVREKIRKDNGPLAVVRQRHENLIVRLVTEIRMRGYAYRTEQTYEQWVCRYIAFCGGKSPENVGASAVTAFLNELVVAGNVSASTQNQALNALVFLYKRVLLMPLGELESLARSKRKKTVPVVLTRSEVKRLLAELDGWQLHLASLLYGTGMRVMEGLTLRVKDIDFEYGRIHVCQAKGKKDRFVPLPGRLVEELRARIEKVAVPVSLGSTVARSPLGQGPSSPSARERSAARGQAGRGPCRNRQASGLPHLPSLLRHAPAGDRSRHPHRPGAARSFGRGDDDDLHPCAQPAGHRRGQPARSLTARTGREHGVHRPAPRSVPARSTPSFDAGAAPIRPGER